MKAHGRVALKTIVIIIMEVICLTIYELVLIKLNHDVMEQDFQQ
jgi:hypothetical protein